LFVDQNENGVLIMNIKLLAATAAGALTLALAGSASALTTVTVGNYTLDDTSFGAQYGVHFNNASLDVTSADATINQDGSIVTFSSSDPFDTNTGGEAVVADGNGGNQDPFNNLNLAFQHAWGQVTFSFDGGTASVMTLVVNGTTTFTGGVGGNCSFCVIGNGETKFTITGNVTPITTLAFTFNPDVGSGRQFRVRDVGQTSVPEPASWAMMLAGFGGIGAMMRRRRSTPALAV
jgi:hypothetical protein